MHSQLKLSGYSTNKHYFCFFSSLLTWSSSSYNLSHHSLTCWAVIKSIFAYTLAIFTGLGSLHLATSSACTSSKGYHSICLFACCHVFSHQATCRPKSDSYTANNSQYRIEPECQSGLIRGRSAERIDIEGRGISIRDRAS